MKTRKLLAIMLAIAVLASFISVPVFADGHEGEALETLGILIGPDEDGVTEAYLATIATRAQAALIDLRLEGNEAAALAFEGTETFTDAADATEFWQPILEFLKATPASGWNGYTDGSFKPNAPITGMEFTKILLVSLGYVEGVDFMYAETMDFAATVGLVALADKADVDLTVGDLAAAIVEALGTKTNSVTDVTLLTQLVLDGVVDEADAVAAGFEVEEEAFVIVDAFASAVDEVTVEMSIDVPDDAVVTLKKGTASYSVAETVTDNVITLTALFNLPAGTYTVTVDEDSAEFEVMAQYAVDLVMEADSVYLDEDQDVGVAMYDQYGDMMSLSGTNYSVFNQSDGFVYAPSVDTAIEIDVEDDIAAEAGDVVFVFVYDPVSMLTVSGELPVIAAPYLETITVGGVTLGDEDATMLLEDTDDNMLAVVGYDQYGQVMTLTDSMFDTNEDTVYDAEVQVLSSNGAVLAASDLYVSGGKVYFDADDPGIAMFTFIIPDQAFIVTSEMITVYADPDVASVEIAGPAGPIYAEEAATFTVVGLDQYGAAIDVANDGRVTFTVTNSIFDSAPAMTGTNAGSLTMSDAGVSTVYYFLDGMFQGTFDLNANEAAYPFQIIGVDAFMAMEEGTSQTIVSEDIEVIDQYGRSYTTREVDPFTDGYSWEITSKAATTLFDDYMGYGYYDIDAQSTDTTGAETFVATLIYDGWQVMTESAFSFDVCNVESGDVDGFAMSLTAGTMYTGATFDYGQVASDYYKTVTVTGTYGDVSVLLDVDANGVPYLIDVITSTNDSVEVMSGATLVPTAETDVAATIKAWQNGVAVAMADQATAKTAPDCVSATAVTTADLTLFNTMFTLKDQYGVALDYDLLQGSRTGLVPTWYFDETEWEDTTNNYFTIVKWDGSLTATYTDAK